MKLFKNLFQKWELFEENKLLIEQSTNILYGTTEFPGRYDVYRKKKWNGMFKYKTVRRY
jgi:hypothetical protein